MELLLEQKEETEFSSRKNRNWVSLNKTRLSIPRRFLQKEKKYRNEVPDSVLLNRLSQLFWKLAFTVCSQVLQSGAVRHRGETGYKATLYRQPKLRVESWNQVPSTFLSEKWVDLLFCLIWELAPEAWWKKLHTFNRTPQKKKLPVYRWHAKKIILKRQWKVSPRTKKIRTPLKWTWKRNPRFGKNLIFRENFRLYFEKILYLE